MDQNKRLNGSTTKKRNLIAYTNPDSIIAERYRTIITNMKFSTSDQNSRTFLITSPSMGEGKSTSAANLAVSIALQKKSVLLIDANLRNPGIHSIFKVSNTNGVTDIVNGKITIEDAIVNTGIGGLDLLTSGTIPPNPVELLGSQMMDQLIKRAAKSYDIVLIDSTSVLEVTDTKLLAYICDGVILVIARGKTTYEEALEAKKILGFAKAKFIGAILNEKDFDLFKKIKVVNK
ncbi:CpsD/CapB family tyrosine-protein kinase [Peribacillus sp. JNUCC 23]